MNNMFGGHAVIMMGSRVVQIKPGVDRPCIKFSTYGGSVNSRGGYTFTCKDMFTFVMKFMDCSIVSIVASCKNRKNKEQRLP